VLSGRKYRAQPNDASLLFRGKLLQDQFKMNGLGMGDDEVTVTVHNASQFLIATGRAMRSHDGQPG
jgi:hypothetical protein